MLTEDRVREIVREELSKLLKEKAEQELKNFILVFGDQGRPLVCRTAELP